jgi:GMP synthase (glutamine-hydrolysing)
MKHFLVIQHTYAEFLGTIEKLLESRDIAFTYQRPFTGQELPGNPLQYDSLWLLGGACPITDLAHCPWIPDELRLIAAFEKSRRPVIGFGFGGLLVAQAHGGTPFAEPLHSAYWTVARKTLAGAKDPVANAVDGKPVLVMINGRVDLPPDVEPLVVDEDGRWLAIRPTRLSYGLLFRPELKPGMIEDMIMEEGRDTPAHIGELLAAARENWEETQVNTAEVVHALFSALDLMTERRKMPVFPLHVVTGKQ